MRRLLLAVAIGVLVAACSSTSRDDRAAPEASGVTSTVSSPSSGAREPSPDREPGGSPASAVSPSRRGGGSGGAPPDAPSGPRRAQLLGPGATRGAITIGIEVTRGADETFAGFGTNTSQGNTQRASEAVVKHINANGGVAGRTLKAIFHETNTNSGSAASQAAATCARFTEDTKVMAVVSGHILLVGSELVDCLAKRKTPLVSALYYPWDDTFFSRYRGYLYEPSYLNASRWGAWIDTLAEKGFFPKSARLGVVRYSGPVYDRIMRDAIQPALQRRGVRIVEEFAPNEPDSTAAVGAVGGASANGILRFRQAQVTHVLFVATQGAVEFFWMPAADAQGYRPRYGLNTFEKPDFLQNNVPATQLRGAVGMGWQPMVDVAGPQDPGGRTGHATCRAAFRSAGMTTFADRNSERFAMQYCDTLLFLKSALDRAGDLTAGGLRSAIEGLRTTYSSPLALGTRFAPNRHWGAELARPIAFSDGCSCWTYSGAARRIG